MGLAFLLQMKVAEELQKGSVATYIKSVQIDHIKDLPFADLVIPDITSGLRNQKLCLAHFTCYTICSSKITVSVDRMCPL